MLSFLGAEKMAPKPVYLPRKELGSYTLEAESEHSSRESRVVGEVQKVDGSERGEDSQEQE